MISTSNAPLFHYFTYEAWDSNEYYVYYNIGFK